MNFMRYSFSMINSPSKRSGSDIRSIIHICSLTLEEGQVERKKVASMETFIEDISKRRSFEHGKLSMVLTGFSIIFFQSNS